MNALSSLGWLILLGGALLGWYIHVPSSMPRDLPRIPIYAWMLGIWWKMSHGEVYNRWIREPMEKHGAVILWYAGRWNVLVGDPALLMDMFRHIDVYVKAGNQVRAPWAVLGTFTGDNIVNSTGSNWELYTSIMKPGLMKTFDPVPIQEKCHALVDGLLQAQREAPSQTGISVGPYLQKFTLDVMARSFFDIELQTLEKPDVPIERLLTRAKPVVFNTLYMNLPILDRFSAVLPSRRYAFKIVAQLEGSIYNMARNDSGNKSSKQSNVVSHLLEKALDEGRITEKQCRSNLNITFMVGHENSQMLLDSAMWELGRNTKVQNLLRSEVLQAANSNIIADDISRLPYLTSTFFELLRLFPPVSQMLNRAAVRPVLLGGKIPIAAGTSMGWNAYSVHTNPRVWGPTAAEFRPERWGETQEQIQANFRRQTVRGAYIPFIAHTRKCLAQTFAMQEIKLALFELVRRMRWRIDPACSPRMSGSTLTFPIGLKVIFEELEPGGQGLE